MTIPHFSFVLRRRAARILRSARGAFDLPSIIVGVVVVGILAAGVLAAVFAVIPFAQDNASKQDLAAVRTAEGVARAKDNRFMNSAGLDTVGYLEDLGKVAVGSDAKGTCYVGMSLSGTGKTYFATDRISDPKVWTSGTDTGCLTVADQEALAASLSGAAAAPAAAPVAPAPTTPVASPAIAVAWGLNSGGQLGNASTVASKPAVHVSTDGVLAGKKVTAVSGGSYHTCGIADRAAYCWGYGGEGTLGNNALVNSNVPVAVNTAGVLAGKTVSALDAGDYHTCAVADGAAYCWGKNTDGQLGNGATARSSVPVAVGGLLTGKTVTAISAGAQSTCAVADNAAYCWGFNFHSQLGNGTSTGSSVPVAVNTTGVLAGKTVSSISVGGIHTCAIASGAAYCWGNGTYGSLGNGGKSTSTVPVAVSTAGVLSGKTISDISLGKVHACVTADYAAYCWGESLDGQVGDGSGVINATAPVAVSTAGVLSGKKVTSVGVGTTHSCAVADGAAYCWGDGSDGKLGNLGVADSNVPVAVNTEGILAGKTVTTVAGGLSHTSLLYAG